MISTKRITSIACKVPGDTASTVYANVLTWHPPGHLNGSKYYTLSPYHLKTDGSEEQFNNGQVLFENFWQGSKVWPVCYDTQVWAHPNLKGNPKHLWFNYKCSNGLGKEQHFDGHTVLPAYFEWRGRVFECPRPIRYPNGRERQRQVAFSLLQDCDGNQTRLDYIAARKRIYVQEYGRLVREHDEFWDLVELVQDGKNLVICELDVPSECKQLTLAYLQDLVEDDKKCFGHGLCLAWEILKNI